MLIEGFAGCTCTAKAVKISLGAHVLHRQTEDFNGRTCTKVHVLTLRPSHQDDVESTDRRRGSTQYLQICITKTYLYYFDPLKPHFYIVKLGFTGVYIIFFISAQKHRGGSNEYPQSMF